MLSSQLITPFSGKTAFPLGLFLCFFLLAVSFLLLPSAYLPCSNSCSIYCNESINYLIAD